MNYTIKHFIANIIILLKIVLCLMLCYVTLQYHRIELKKLFLQKVVNPN